MKSDDKEKKMSDNICSKGPNLSLPRIQNPSDILLWWKNYKQMSEYIPNDLTKISLIKNSYSLTEPWTLSQSLKNIDEFLLTATNFYEFKLESNMNSKFRDDL